MSHPNDGHPRMQRRILAVRVASAALVALAVGGIVAVGPLQTPAADAAAPTSSALTVKWTGDTSAASSFQPVRSSASPHYREFDDIAITVSQTQGIIDQAIRVSVTGFAGTRDTGQTALVVDNAKNFLQAMQCWGTDPSAVDFRETCQWGGKYGENNGLGNSVYFDNLLRVPAADMDTAHPTNHDVPFRTADGAVISGKNTVVDGETRYPIREYFSAATSNEVQSARVGSDGTGFFDFETQSADTAPHLGCGTIEHRRCWLVVVPRGTVFGGDYELCSNILDPANNFDPYTKGRANSIQGGSPLNTGCDYWDNRIVVPLDFAPVGASCAVGGTESRVIGSQLMIGAMSSWQPALCQSVKSTFSFSTMPDSIGRAQLIESGSNTASIAYTGYPVSSGELQTEDERALLARTDLSYTPVAISSVVIAFLAESSNGRQEQLTLSPRLMAKFLTQSYPFLVPGSSSDPDKNSVQLGAVNRTYRYLYLDPEFKALNPSNYNQFTSAPAIALPGPSGADAIRQVWRWILADNDAVAFMNGEPDPWGMTVNPYYLPKGHANAVVPWYLDDQQNYSDTPAQRLVGVTNLDGTPRKLTEQALDTFPKNDETLMPLQLTGQRSRFDTLQYSPYADTLLSAARQAFRADPSSKTYWDPNKINPGGTVGDWVSGGAQLPGQKFLLAVTDSVSAQRWGLSTAAITGPNGLAATSPDAAAMTTALTAMEATSLDSVRQVNPAKVAAGGYPMTIVTYAGVNLTKTDAAERLRIAAMLTQVTTDGQVPGSGVGQLPAGYVPLTSELVTLAVTSVDGIQSYVPPATVSGATAAENGYAQDDYDDSYAAAADSSSLNGGASAPQVTAGADPLADDRTAASSVGPMARSGLAISLGVGLAGFLFSPILFRGRGFP